jgi:hypothetical protein
LFRPPPAHRGCRRPICSLATASPLSLPTLRRAVVGVSGATPASSSAISCPGTSAQLLPSPSAYYSSTPSAPHSTGSSTSTSGSSRSTPSPPAQLVRRPLSPAPARIGGRTRLIATGLHLKLWSLDSSSPSARASRFVTVDSLLLHLQSIGTSSDSHRRNCRCRPQERGWGHVSLSVAARTNSTRGCRAASVRLPELHCRHSGAISGFHTATAQIAADFLAVARFSRSPARGC